MSGNCGIFKHHLAFHPPPPPLFFFYKRISVFQLLLQNENLKITACDKGLWIHWYFHPDIAKCTFNSALNLCDWHWFWTIQSSAFLSHQNAFLLITNQVLLPRAFWSSYSLGDSVQCWLKTKKVLPTTNVAHYYNPHYSLNKKLAFHSGVLVAPSSSDYIICTLQKPIS